MTLAFLIAAAMAVVACAAVALPSSGSIPPPSRRAASAARRRPCREPGGWPCVAVTNLTAATDYLDQLEACGVADRELVVINNNRFLIYWRRPTG